MKNIIDFLEDKGDLLASKGKLKRAVRYFDRASALGSGLAFHAAAYYLEQLKGIKFIGTRYRYKNAVARGISNAAFNLAVNAASLGDRQACYRWLSTACRIGNIEARRRRAEMRRNNLNIPDFKATHSK